MQFLLYIDYKARKGNVRGYDYIPMEAEDLYPAMMEAEKYHTEDIYMMKIMTKEGRITSCKNIKTAYFKAFVECRGNEGWRINAADTHRAKFEYFKSLDGNTYSWGEAI